MKILIVVDPQNDFVDEKGALSIKGATDCLPDINELTTDKFDLVIATQDWHPKNHVSFASTNGATLFTEKETIQGIKTIRQVMWPDHCVQDTWGAEFHKGFDSRFVDMIWRKGNHTQKEQYSAFEYCSGEFTNLAPMLTVLPTPTEIIIVGFALDFCVKQTAYGILRYPKNDGVKVTVYEKLCAAVYEENREQTINEMENFGVKIIRGDDWRN